MTKAIDQLKRDFDVAEPVAVAVVAFFEGDFRRAIAALSVAHDERSAADVAQAFSAGITAILAAPLLERSADPAIVALVDEIIREAFGDIEQYIEQNEETRH